MLKNSPRVIQEAANHGHRSHKGLASDPASAASCMTLGEFFNIPKPPFLHLLNEDNTTYPPCMAAVENENKNGSEAWNTPTSTELWL